MKFLSNHKNKYQIKQNYQSLLIPMHSIKHGSINCYKDLSSILKRFFQPLQFKRHCLFDFI